ncbi:hypothetical protein Ctob_014956 [Chrysochromulina tobinii]|uniref:B30.2/SPRY domain-containing protein n=1 Tax=Chrysochromulina tobinii TaxID=1460289 RepID=A0A0M0JWP8_9EUKA|nr:hypothetical protein Ctob_014956 [Chrysochromulina tobinii]|eukprot:KOO30955.1 hypothetical protein Ctob_014956 [Chrysochromulina sp. CCMP291]
MNTIKARPQNLTGTWRMRYLRRLEAASVKVEFGTAVAQVKCMGSSEKTPQNPFISFSLCDDGSKWRNDKVGRPAVVFDTATDTEMIQGEVFAEPFGNCAAKPDVIGCGIDFKRRSIFFTKNGQLMGTAFEDVDVDPGGVGLAYGPIAPS